MNMHVCPRCAAVHGGDGLRFDWNSGTVEYAGRSVKFTHGEMQILEHLVDGGDRGVRVSELVAGLYGDRPDGGPVTVVKSLLVRISRMRRVLREAGMTLDIVNMHHGGGRYVLKYGKVSERYGRGVA